MSVPTVPVTIRVFTQHGEPAAGVVVRAINALVAMAAFRPALAILKRTMEEGRVTQGVVAMDIAKAAVPALDAAGISNESIAKVIDVVGEMLTEKQFLWLRNTPDVWVAGPDEESPGVFIQYRIAVTPAEAADMNWDLVSRLTARDLLAPGFSAGFLGTKVREAVAA